MLIKIGISKHLIATLRIILLLLLKYEKPE